MAHEPHTETLSTPAVVDETAPIVSLTEMAVEMVKQTLAREHLGSEYGLRVAVVGGGCSGFQYSLNLDSAKADDQIVEQDGVRLLVDTMSIQYLKGITIDYVTGLHGAGFKFVNPNATRTCGCGSSFSA